LPDCTRVEIALALSSALLFALGSVLTQRAGLDAPTNRGGPLLVQMARRPVWLAGIASDAFGFVAQAAALGVGRLAVVQPLLVTSIVFALPLGVRFSAQRVRRGDVVAAGLVVLALVAFLLIATPSGGRSEAPVKAWLLTGAVCIGLCAPLVALGRRGPPARRAALLGCATGVMFALAAALTKAVVDELHRGIVPVIASWPPYALAVVGYASMTLNQMALNTGALAATVASSTAVDPVASVVLGVVLFDESLSATAPATVIAVAALVVGLAAMAALARSEAHPVGSEPRPGAGARAHCRDGR
jgi:drug/metabolite transporter (DMT)-like permease